MSRISIKKRLAHWQETSTRCKVVVSPHLACFWCRLFVGPKVCSCLSLYNMSADVPFLLFKCFEIIKVLEYFFQHTFINFLCAFPLALRATDWWTCFFLCAFPAAVVCFWPANFSLSITFCFHSSGCKERFLPRFRWLGGVMKYGDLLCALLFSDELWHDGRCLLTCNTLLGFCQWRWCYRSLMICWMWWWC